MSRAGAGAMWSVLLLVLELVLVLVIMVRSVPESGEVLVHVVRSTLTVFSEVGLLAVESSLYFFKLKILITGWTC